MRGPVRTGPASFRRPPVKAMHVICIERANALGRPFWLMQATCIGRGGIEVLRWASCGAPEYIATCVRAQVMPD